MYDRHRSIADLDDHDGASLHKSVLSEAQESYVRGARDLRPRSDSSPEARRARPYPSPQERPRRLSAAVHPDSAQKPPAAADEQACDVPGCNCTAGRAMGSTRLRPAFQDSGAHPRWTVLEDDSEDADS